MTPSPPLQYFWEAEQEVFFSAQQGDTVFFRPLTLRVLFFGTPLPVLRSVSVVQTGTVKKRQTTIISWVGGNVRNWEAPKIIPNAQDRIAISYRDLALKRSVWGEQTKTFLIGHSFPFRPSEMRPALKISGAHFDRKQDRAEKIYSAAVRSTEKAGFVDSFFPLPSSSILTAARHSSSARFPERGRGGAPLFGKMTVVSACPSLPPSSQCPSTVSRPFYTVHIRTRFGREGKKLLRARIDDDGGDIQDYLPTEEERFK